MSTNRNSVLSEIVYIGTKRRKLILESASDVSLEADVEAAIHILNEKPLRSRYDDVPKAAMELQRERTDFCFLLLATLLSRFDQHINLSKIPTSVLCEIREQATRMMEADVDVALHSMRNDIFQKDLAICRSEAYPCFAQIVEFHAGYSRWLIRNGNFRQTIAFAKRLISDRLQNQPYLEIHTHTPMLSGFNEHGWDRCYELCADILELHPEHLGLLGSSWFYDPVVPTISPRLEYLVAKPKSGGANFFFVGSSPSDYELATATSPSRRKLAEEGSYLPTKYLMLWHRDALINWVSRSSRRDSE